MSQVESFIPESAQSSYYQNTLPMSSLVQQGEALAARIQAEREANPPQVDYNIAALANSSQLSSMQKQALNKDTYNYIYNRNAFEAEHGRKALQDTDLQVSQLTAPDPVDTRTPLRRVGDIALGFGTGAVESGMGILGLGASVLLPGSGLGTEIFRTAGNLSDKALETFGSDYMNAARRGNASKQAAREALSKARYEQDMANGDSDFIATVKKFGRDIIQWGANTINDPNALEQVASNAFGSLALSGPVSKGLAMAGKAIGKGSSATAKSIAAHLSREEGKSLAAKVFGNEGLTNSILEMGGSASGAVASVDAMTVDELMANPEFAKQVQEYMNQGMTEASAFMRAKNDLAGSVARWAAGVTSLIAAPAGAIADKVVKNPFNLSSWNPLKVPGELASRAGKEATEEAMQGFAQIGENLGMRNAGYDRDILEGVAQNIAEGAIGGAVSGAGGPVVGTAGNIAKTAALTPAWIYQHTSSGQARRLKNAYEIVNNNIQTIQNSSLDDTTKKEWIDSINSSSSINLNDIQVQNDIKNEIGRELSPETIKTFKANKGIGENIHQLLRKADKLSKSRNENNQAKAEELRQDVESIIAYVQNKSNAMLGTSSIETEILQGQQEQNDKVIPSSAQASFRKALIEGLQEKDKAKRLSNVAEALEQKLPIEQLPDENPSDFIQRKNVIYQQAAKEYINTYAQLQKTDEKTGKNKLDNANELASLYKARMDAVQASNEILMASQSFHQANKEKALERNIAARIAQNNYRLSKLNKPNFSNQDVQNISHLVNEILYPETSAKEQEAFIKKVKELKETHTGSLAQGVINSLPAIEKAYQAKQAYASNPEYQQIKTHKQSIDFFGKMLFDPNKEKLTFDMLKTWKNKHEAYNKGIAYLAQNPFKDSVTISYQDVQQNKEEKLTVDKDMINEALVRERELAINYNTFRPDNVEPIKSSVANLTKADFKKKNIQKAASKLIVSQSQQEATETQEQQNPEPESKTEEKASENNSEQPNSTSENSEENKQSTSNVSHSAIASGSTKEKYSHETDSGVSPKMKKDFIQAYEDKDIVVFDIETAGDITKGEKEPVQISAKKYHNGKLVAEFKTQWIEQEPDENGNPKYEIPKTLHGQANPIHSEYSRHEHVPFTTAYEAFTNFIGDAALAGHNISGFDIEALIEQAKHYDLDTSFLESKRSSALDTLTFSKALWPKMKIWKQVARSAYELTNLVHEFGFSSTNTHNAEDDIAATKELLTKIYEQLKNPEQITPSEQKELSKKEQEEQLRKERKEQFVKNVGEFPVVTQNKIDTEDITKVQQEGDKVYIFAGSHIVMQRISANTWWFYDASEENNAISNEAKIATEELSQWAERVVKNKHLLSDNINEAPAFEAYDIDISPENIEKVHVYTGDNVIRIYFKNNPKEIAYEKMPSGDWIIRTKRKDVSFYIASPEAAKKLDNAVASVSKIETYSSSGYGQNAGTPIAEIKPDNAVMSKTAINTLIDTDSNESFSFYHNGVWVRHLDNGKTQTVRNKVDANALNRLVMGIALKGNNSAVLSGLIQHVFRTPIPGESYELRLNQGKSTVSPLSIDIVRKADGKETVIARRTLTNAAKLNEPHWVVLNTKTDKLSSVINTQSGRTALEIIMHQLDPRMKIINEFDESLPQPEAMPSAETTEVKAQISNEDELLTPQSKKFNAFPEKQGAITPGSQHLWDAMTPGLASMAATIFNRVSKKNLLNRMADPLRDLNMLFNSILEVKDADGNIDDAKRKEIFKEFFYEESEGNIRWETLYNDIFYSENDANLKALKDFFTPDPEVSLLYRLISNMQRDLPLSLTEKVQEFFKESMNTTAGSLDAFNKTSTHNGNMFFMTKDANGNLVYNNLLLVRVALGALNTYMTMNQTENMDPEKSSLSLSLFNSEASTRDQVLSVIGYAAETDEHIQQQISSNVKEFLGLSHTREGGKQIDIEDSIINSISKTLFNAMYQMGLFTKHRVTYVIDKNSTSNIASSTEIESYHPYADISRRPYKRKVTFGSVNSNNVDIKEHVFVTVNKANMSNDKTLRTLASGLCSQLAFILENMLLAKQNNNVMVGKPSKQVNDTVYHSQNEEKLTSEQIAEVKALNEVPSYMNSFMKGLLDNLTDADIENFFDAAYDNDEARNGIANILASESQKGVNITLATELRNARDLIQKIKNYRLAQQESNSSITPMNEVPIFFQHAVNSMGRFMMLGGANTQASKLLRELFIARNKAEYAKRGFKLNNNKMSHLLFRSICAGFGVRVNQANGLTTEANKFLLKELSEKLKNKDGKYLFNTEAWKNFQNALKAELDTELDKTLISNLLLELKNCEDADHSWLSINACIELARYMNALSIEPSETENALEQIIDTVSGAFRQTPDKQYIPCMYIENDGVTSGPAHSQHLLSTGAFTLEELKVKAATGYSFIPGSYADSYKFAGADIYQSAAKFVNDWFANIAKGVVAKNGSNTTLLIDPRSLAINNDGDQLSVRTRSFENGKIVEHEPEVITPGKLLTALLNAMHIAMPDGFNGETEARFTEALLNDVVLKRSLTKKPLQVHTYEAGRDTITKNILNMIIKPFLDMQTKHNRLVKKRNQEGLTESEQKALDDQLKQAREQITEMGMYLHEAALVTVSDSLYNDDATSRKNQATFLLDPNMESLELEQWIPQLNPDTGMYDTHFSLGPKAINILTRNMQHLLVNPLINNLEKKVYSPESMKNKKLLTAVSTTVATLYEGIEAYYLAELIKLNKEAGTPLTQEQIDHVFDKIRGLMPQLVEDLTLDGSKINGNQPLHIKKKISIMKEQAIKTTIREAFPNMFPDKTSMDRLFKSGDGISKPGSNSINPQASISVRGHTDYGVGVMIMTIQGLAEAAVIAAAAQAKFNIQDQFDGINVDIDDQLEAITEFNNHALGQVWQKLNVFEIFKQTLGDFADNLNAKDNAELFAILREHLTANVDEDYLKEAEAVQKPRNSKQAQVKQDAALPDAGFPVRLNATQYAGFTHYSTGTYRKPFIKYTPWQNKLAKTLKSLVDALDLAAYNQKGGKAVSENYFKQMLFEVHELTPEECPDAKKREKYNEEIKSIQGEQYQPEMLSYILSQAYAKLHALARDSELRREAWNFVGDTYVDQLASIATAAKIEKKSLVYKDKNGVTHTKEFLSFFKTLPNGMVDWNSMNIEESMNAMVNALNEVYDLLRNNEDIAAQTLSISLSQENPFENFNQRLLEVQAKAELVKLQTDIVNTAINTGDAKTALLQALKFSKNEFKALWGSAFESNPDANVVFRLVQGIINADNSFLKNTRFLSLSSSGAAKNPETGEWEASDELNRVLQKMFPHSEELRNEYREQIIAEAAQHPSYGGMVIVESTGKNQVIVINNGAIGNDSKLRSETILHEIMHATFDSYVNHYVLVQDGKLIVDANLRKIDPVAFKMLQGILQVYEEGREILRQAPEGTILANINRVINPEGNLTSEQQLLTLKEFIAYALSNREFAEALSSTKNQSQAFRTLLNQGAEEAKKTASLLGKFYAKLREIGNLVVSFVNHILGTNFKHYKTDLRELEQKHGVRPLNNLAWGFNLILGTDSYGQLYEKSREGTQPVSHSLALTSDMKKSLSKQDAKILEKYFKEEIPESYFDGMASSYAFFVAPEKLLAQKDDLEEMLIQYYLMSANPIASEFSERYAFLAEQIKPLVTEDIFDDDETSTAKEKYDFIMADQTLIDFNLKLLVLAKTNEKLQAKMQETYIPEQKYESTGSHTIDNFMRLTGEKINSWINNRLDPTIAQNTNLAQAVFNIHQKANGFFTRLENRIGSPVNYLFDLADTKATEQINREMERLRTAKSPMLNIIGNALHIVFTEYGSDKAKSKLRRWLNTHEDIVPKFISELTVEIMGTSLKDTPVFILAKRIKNSVQKLRQTYRSEIPKNIRKMFGSSITGSDWESLFTSVGQTAIWSIASHAPQLIEALPDMMRQNSSDLSREIKSYESLVQRHTSQNTYDEVITKTKQLGHYMATHEAGNMLIRNTWAIAQWHLGSVDPELEANLNVLVSLYAIRDLSSKDKEVFRKAWEVTQEGMKNIINLMEAIHIQEQNKLKALEEELNKPGPVDMERRQQYVQIRMNAYQNYMPMESIEGADMIIADDAKEKQLLTRGYRRKGSYNNKLDTYSQRGYYYSTLAPQAGFMEGTFVSVSPTYNGIYQNTLQSVQGSERNLITNPYRVTAISERMARLGNTSQSNSGDDLIPVYSLEKDGTIKIIAYERSFNKEMNQIINKHYQLPDVIGIMQGRQVEELAAQIYNAASGIILIDEYKRIDSKKNEFIDLLNPEGLTVIQKDAVRRIPMHILNIIKEQFKAAGLGEHIYVRKDLAKDIIGERRLSIREIFNPSISDISSKIIKPTEWILRKAFGDNALRYAVRGEEALQSITSWAKSTIIVRSVRLCLINGVANIYHLSLNGVPAMEILREIPHMYSQCEKYSKYSKEIRSLEMEISMSRDSQKIKQLQSNILSLQRKIESLDIYPIIDEFSIINDMSRNENDLKLTRGQFGEWMVDFANKFIPEPIRNVGRYAFMARDTAAFEMLEKATQYGDFIAKAILYKHWVTKGIYDKDKAKKLIMDEFVNYDKNSGRFRTYLESIGLGWFFNYRLRIMKTAERSLRNHPVRALTTMFIPHPGLTGSDVGDVFSDSIIGKILGGLGMSNLGWGFFKTAWDSLPLVVLFGLL